MIQRLRWWLVRKLVGKTPIIGGISINKLVFSGEDQQVVVISPITVTGQDGLVEGGWFRLKK